MKNGLFLENDGLIYYKDGQPYHAGVIEVEGAIYYISSKGRAVKGEHIVHREMANDILKRGTYTFGDDYKLIKSSYRPPKTTKKRSRKSSRKPRRGIRLNRKKLSISILAVSLTFLFVGALLWIGNSIRPTDETGESTGSARKIVLSGFEEDVLLCSSAAKAEFDGQLSLKDAVASGAPYYPFVFEYQLSDSPGTLLLSEDEAFSNAKSFELPVDSSNISIDNLKTNTDYYYKVIAGDKEQTGSFHTAASTRFVSIPGLINTRDIGGYVNQDGKTIKQGLLIRGVELDGLVNADYFIPADELDAVQETFGFVYDLDLRGKSTYDGAYSSRLGVPHRFYGAPMYGEIFNESAYTSLYNIFSDLADARKYPMYLHCTWGTDRTGTVIFLLQGILNMSTEDMIREYELTGYTNPDLVGNSKMEIIISGLQPYPGDTLQEKIVNYLTTAIGISGKDIESIRSIFLED